MFRVTAKTDYAVRALVEIARHHPQPVKGREIAEAQQLPYRFLAGTMTQLSRAGVLDARRGSGVECGYRLGRPPEHISLGDVVLAIEGRIVDVRAGRDADSEALSSPVWAEIGSGVEAALDRISVADLV